MNMEYSDPIYKNTLLQNLEEYFFDNTYTDFNLNANNGSVSCHKLVLLARSSYFRDILKDKSGRTTCFTLPDTDCVTLKAVVQFMYTGKLCISTETVCSTYLLVKQLGMTNLISACKDFMLNNINASNCLGYLEFSRQEKMLSLKWKADGISVHSFREVAESNEIFQLTQANFVEYISDDMLNIENEDIVFDTVLKWIMKNATEEKHQEMFHSLIKSVRLTHCSSQYLKERVAEEPLMQSAFCKKILQDALVSRLDLLRSQNDLPRCMGKTLYIVGGITSDPTNSRRSNPSMTCYKWGIRSKQWENGPSMPPTGCRFAASCTVGNGILVTGGAANACWYLSEITQKWRQMPSLIRRHFRHSCAVIGDTVYVLGGLGEDQNRPLSYAEKFQLHADKWADIPELTRAVSDAPSAVWKSSVFLFGGTTSGNTTTTLCQCYDSSEGQWKRILDLPQEIKGSSAVVYLDDILIIGGCNATCMSYSPVHDEYTALRSPHSCHGFAPVVRWRDLILVLGGKDKDNATTDIIKCYDPALNEWLTWSAKLPTPLFYHNVFEVNLR